MIFGDRADQENAAITDSEANLIIKTTNLQKIYDTGEVQVHALRGIDFQVSQGEMVAVMAPAARARRHC